MQILETVTSAIRGRMQNCAQKSEEGRGLNRWVVYKQLCVAKSTFGLNDRCLAVLSSLLSFLPDGEINEKHGLVVFPSNRQLSLRAHGMPESTLRRHLASLVEAGIIERKDSPTRKRYAHKDKNGGIEVAFGFSFAPLVSRATEIAHEAERIIADQKTVKRLRDEVSVIRREITAVFTEIDPEARSGDLESLFVRFREIVDTLPRRAAMQELQAIKTKLEAVCSELDNLLKINDNVAEMSASDAQYERHYNESLSESLFESNLVQKNDLKVNSQEKQQISSTDAPQHHSEAIPLDMVLRACPDIREYATDGIRSWRDLFNISNLVSRFLGITQSAYLEAQQTMGMEGVSAVIAWLLQRAADIQSPGGYLRSLTQKARAGGFSIPQLLMTSLKANKATTIKDFAGY